MKKPAPDPELPLTLHEAAPLNPVSHGEPPNMLQMMQSLIASGKAQENVEVLGKLLEYQRSMEDRQAEKDFAAAFVALQAEMPKVQATRPVPNKDGTVRYHFAPFEEIMKQVQPMLKAHGFTVTFSTDYQVGPPPRLVKTCTLQHVGGHKRTNSFAVRVGSGPPGASEAQGDGAASTYAKRFVLCDALAIVTVGLDDDARLEGDVTTKLTDDQFEHVRQRLDEVRADKMAFLKLFSVTKLADIPAAQYQRALELLDKKERQNERDARVPV